MLYHLRVGRLKLPLKSLSFIVLMLLLCAVFPANAQKHNYQGLTYGGGSYGNSGNEWGIALTAGYDVPQGDLATTFKAAPTFGISVIHNIGDFSFNATIGFVSFKPKSDTVFVDPADHTAGYVHFDNFSSIEIYAGAAYNITISDKAKFYFGVDLGSYYTHFAYDANVDFVGESSADSNGEGSYIAPKLGIKFMMSDNISLGIEGKYNFILTSSSGTGDAYDYGYDTSVTKTYSANVVLTYNF